MKLIVAAFAIVISSVLFPEDIIPHFLSFGNCLIAEESEFTPKSIQTRDSRANLVYAVKIAVKNDGRLKLGQYGEVRL